MTTSPKLLLIICTGALFLHLISSTQAATFTTNAFSDAFVTPGPSGNLSGNNYGAAGALGLSAPGSAKGEFQSVLQFDLAGARNAFDNEFGAGQWNIQTINFQLTAAPNNNAIFNSVAAGLFQVYWMQNDSWTEGTGSPNAPTTSGITFDSLQATFVSAGDENLGTFSFNGATSGPTSYTLDLTPGFMADLLSGDEVSLRLVAADTSVTFLFNSRNFGTAGSRPQFILTAVPEPGTTALGGVAITFLVIWNRLARRRRT